MCLRLDGSDKWQSSGIALVNLATSNGAPVATCALSNLDSQAVLVVQYSLTNDGAPNTSPPPTTNVTATVTQLAFTIRLPNFTPASFTAAAQAQYAAALKAATSGEAGGGWPQRAGGAPPQQQLEESLAHGLAILACCKARLAASPSPLPHPLRPQ